MSDKQPIKIAKHGGKDFKSRFLFVGKVKPVKKKNEMTESWDDEPFYQEKTTSTGRPRRVLQFNIETAKGNELKAEVAGMEQKVAYIYSQKNRHGQTIAWEDRLDKSKYPDETYTIINGTDWDRAKLIGDQIAADQWVEIRGYYDFSSFTDGEGREIVLRKRIIEQFKIIEDGAEIAIDRTEKVKYKTDFDSEEFVEVNKVHMQIGVVSTFQEDSTQDTKINGIFIKSGKESSEPFPVDATVYYKETSDGSMPLANAVASLKKLDFIEVIAIDNNRQTFAYVDVQDELDEEDPFAQVSSESKKATQERVANGSKKGLEVTGYVVGKVIRNILLESDYVKPSQVNANSGFGGNTLDIDESDLPF